jgi:metal-responsive CopG/Arc/MetJ family transcriptional regulator
MEKKINLKKRVTLNLDQQTLDTLGKIAESNAYDTISSAIRIMVKRYASNELQQTSSSQSS